ncbi:MAG: sugar phosphate isomerase/epimerase family protein, partial [Candidatus Latescibacteria bacterium]|nr:sugar phosphate isomerase/epimerase family protein [Candidatus Latescibacterota bacterium]
VNELRRVADDLGLLIWSIHSPDLGSIASPDGRERRQQIDVLKACIDQSGTLGARAIPSHALLIAPFDQDPEGSEARISDALDELTAAAEGCPAQLAFENAGFPSAASTRSVHILDRLETLSPAGFGFVLDTGHANIDGDLAEIDRHVGAHLISLHLNDNAGESDSHLVPGEGTVDWADVWGLIRRSGYRGVAMYEIELGDSEPEARLRSTMEAHLRISAGS